MNPIPLLLVVPALLSVPQEPIPGRRPKETVLPDETVVLPLDLSHGWPVVEVGIGEKGPYRMIVDTGASVTVLESRMKAELGLESIGKTRIGDPSNPTANEADIVELSWLRLGDAYFEELTAIAWERDMGLAQAGIDGIVGLPVFQDCLVTFDYAAGELRIHAGELPPADGRRVLDFELGGHVNLPLEVGGERVEAHLDSGNSRGMVLPGRLEEKLALVPGSETSGQGMRASGPVEFTGGVLAGEARIGGLVLEQPRVAFDHSLPFANLGRNFFELGTVTLDLANGRIELGAVPESQTEEAPPVATHAPEARRVDMSKGRRKLGIEMILGGGADLRVGRVIPGSLAESCGLQAGDVLRKVDGVAVSPANTTPLSAVLSTPAAFEIEVERGGEAVVIAVPGKDDVSPEALLDRLLGSYTIEARMWRGPGTEPRAFSGKASFERAHEGRFVRESFALNVGDGGGRELAGDAYLAWRPEAKRFELTQIDAFSSTTYWLIGEWEAERERLAFRSVPASRVPPRDDELRWEYRFEDDGVFVKEMLGPDANGDFYVKSDYRYLPMDELADESAGER